jgi:hypothetical protein
MEVVTHCGRWIQGHREILTRASLSPFTWQNSGRVTVSGSSVFLHLFAWPKHDFCWAEVDEPLRAAILWPKKIPLAFEQQGARILLQTTEHPAPADGCCTIELQFENAPKPAIVSTSFWIPDE